MLMFASPRALPRDGGWTDPSGAVGRGAPWVSPPGPRGDGCLSGEDGGRDPADFGAWGVRPPRADGPAAGAQPPEPPGPPEEDEVERADHGTLPPWGRGGHVSGAVPAGWSHQERPPGGIRRCACHFHLSRPAGGRQRG